VYVKCMGRRVLLGRPEGKRRLGRPRRIWEDNIKNGSKRNGIGCYGLGYQTTMGEDTAD
jgi:hypothetical protein